MSFLHEFIEMWLLQEFWVMIFLTILYQFVSEY